jgi:predicted MFS family arabinose efflux permease
VGESPEHGWRWAFTTCGMIGVIYALPLLTSLQNPTRSAPDAAAKTTEKGVVKGLLTNFNFILLVLYFTLPAIAGWVVRDWMPEILRQKFSLGQGKSGVTAVLFVQVASLVGALAGGALADGWMRRNMRGRIFVSAIGMSLFLPALFSVGNAGTVGVAVAGLILFGIGWGLFDCNNMPILCQIVRPEWRATGYGIMNMVSLSCGAYADKAFGVLRDRQVPLNLIFGVFAGIALLSVIIVLCIRLKQSPETAPAAAPKPV